MAHDFANRQRKKSQAEVKERPRGAVPKPAETSGEKHADASTRLPGWGWLGIGLAAGFLLAQLFPSGSSQEPEVAARAPGEGQAVLVEEDASSAQRPRFDFYTLLPESEVIAPKVEAYRSTPRDAENLPSFMLQTGSFRQRSDAEQQARRLQTLGFDNISISQVESGNGNWFRVRVGPYQDRRLRARAQDDLAAAGVDFMMVSVGTGSQPTSSTSAAASRQEERQEERQEGRQEGQQEERPEVRERSAQELAGLPRFMLQAGSFRRLADAERQRERLQGLGFEEIAISGVQTASGDTWHRVQLGPYQNPDTLMLAQETLKAAGIDYMLLRLRDQEQGT